MREEDWQKNKKQEKISLTSTVGLETGQTILKMDVVFLFMSSSIMTISFIGQLCTQINIGLRMMAFCDLESTMHTIGAWQIQNWNPVNILLNCMACTHNQFNSEGKKSVLTWSFFVLKDDATYARYWMTFLVFSVFPAPDSPLRKNRKVWKWH